MQQSIRHRDAKSNLSRAKTPSVERFGAPTRLTEQRMSVKISSRVNEEQQM